MCRIHVFAQFFEQAGVKASRFDAISNFYRVKPSTFSRGVGKVLLESEYL